MALPTQTDLDSLGFARLGEPFAPLTAPSVADTTTLGFARLAEPLVAPTGSGGGGNRANMVISPFVPS